ncbi:serine/threonine-protein phosphatase 4 regulatory subunit 3 [Elysia marginata]|uniref:Serine/threonine-protein phosphatase 4 regulatory subunit 3 n=1 Tax=Elysia marginata TaxID=1093978 RepID=A0AAV4IDE8_9GAST|nr:serine/threonine-protein phosphatase 4 regulatory subunit 3 [Elysia marginata]
MEGHCQLISELLTFCVEHHTYHIKNYVISKNVLNRVLVLLKSRHSFLVLCALRFCRKIVGLKEEVYNKYIIKENCFRPIVDAFLANGDRYNLINSAMIELFEFIKVEDIKSLSTHIVEAFQRELDGIKYVKTFETLKVRYEQQRERNRDKHFDSPCRKSKRLKKSMGKKGLPPVRENKDEEAYDRHTTSVVRNNRFRRDARALEEEEEIWFNQDDDENETGMQVSDLKYKLDSDLDHIHKLWETKKAKENQDAEDGPPRLLIGTKSPINISIKTGSNSSLSSLLSMPDSPGSPHGSPPAPGSPESPKSPPTSPHSPSRLCPTPQTSPVTSSSIPLASKVQGAVTSTSPLDLVSGATSSTTNSNSDLPATSAVASTASISLTSNLSPASVTTCTANESLPSSNAVTTLTPGLKGLVDYPDEDSEEEEEEDEEDVIAPSPKRPRVGT